MTPKTADAYRTIIADLEREISEHEAAISAHEAQIADAHAALIVLRRRMAALSDALAHAPSETPSEQESAPSSERPRKGDVKEAVFEAIRSAPGITGNMVADALESQLGSSPATNKRKLVHSTISYLVKRGLVERGSDGGLEVAVPMDWPAPRISVETQEDNLGF